MIITADSWRKRFAQTIVEDDVYMAWGRGNPAWDDVPVSATGAETALTLELGRRKASLLQYVTPDANGSINAPVYNSAGAVVYTKFSASIDPTPFVHMVFMFEKTDHPTENVREIGVFAGTVLKPSVPVSQTYYLPVDLQSPGSLMLIENLAQKIVRTSNTRQTFSFVLAV